MGSRKWQTITIISLLIITLAAAYLVPAVATLDEYRDEHDRIQDKLSEKEKEQKLAESELTKLRNELDELETELEAAQKHLIGLQLEIQKQEAYIEKQQLLIAATELSIEETEQYLAVQTEYLEMRLRAIYQNGTVSYLEVLFSASSFTDFLSRFGFLRSLLESDAELVDKIQAARDSLEADKALLVRELNLLVEHREILEESREQALIAEEELQLKSDNYRVLSSKVQSELSKIKGSIAELEREEKRIADEIKKLEELERIGAGKPPTYLAWPSPASKYITSPFGYRWLDGKYRMHWGIDIGRNRDTPVVAAASGIVEIVGWSPNGYGHYVIVSHGGGYLTVYAHMRERARVNAGQTVLMGEQIGIVGSTGYSFGPHLHFEVRVNGVHQDPAKFEYR